MNIIDFFNKSSFSGNKTDTYSTLDLIKFATDYSNAEAKELEKKQLMIKTAIEVIEPYIEYPDTRSVDPITGDCVFNGPNGKVCAFAQMVREEDREKLNEEDTVDNLLDSVGVRLKEEYSEFYYERQFLGALMRIHDTCQTKDIGNRNLRRLIRSILSGRVNEFTL